MERISGPLLGDPTFGYWGSPSTATVANIPVCFENPQDFTALTLQNGWTNAPFATRNAAVMNNGGVIRFAGAIATTGTNMSPFTLPAEFRPPADVYVPVDLCGAQKGRLVIQATGLVTVQGTVSSAQCFTSLEGATFALSSAGYTGLALLNGWTNTSFSTRAAQVKNDNGIIRFQGAIANGTTTRVFNLPAGFRPSTNVYVNVDLCGAAQGRLIILPSGQVDVQAEVSFGDAQCFTSLEGVSFNSTVPSTALTLINGWTNAPFGTANAAAYNKNGIIQLRGAIATTNTNMVAFTLPSAMRPANNVYAPVDLCGAAKGRLFIQPSGSVTVQPIGTLAPAQCFTSLEGVSFATNAGNDSVFRGWVRDAVERTWQRYGRLFFSGWGPCTSITVDSGIHVLLQTVFDGRVVPLLGPDGRGHVGRFALDGRRAQVEPTDQGLWLNPNMAEARTRNVATHEFGHALGFWHEESRWDAPAQCGNGDGIMNNGAAFGNYDTASVMSYCGGQANGAQRLSANDIASVQKVYGRKVLGQLVSPHGNCIESTMWTTGSTGNRPKVSSCNELSGGQLWAWKRNAANGPFAFGQNLGSDPSHTAAITMLNATDGTKIETRDLVTAAYQWTLDNIEIRGFGAKCLTYPGTVGAQLTMMDCSSRAVPPTRNANQRWDRLDPNGRLRLNGTNVCVAIPNKNAALAGQKLITATCNSTDTAQQFAFGNDGPQISSVKYRANQSFCFDVVGISDANFVVGQGGPVDGATIQLATCSTATSLLPQNWNLTGQLRALGKCLDRVNGADVPFITEMQTMTCQSAASGDFVTNSAAQEWDIYWL